MEASPDFFDFSARASFLRRLALPCVAILAITGPASAQFTFSINHRGPTNTVPDSATFTCITAGDVLAAPPPGAPAYAPPVLPPPGKVIPAGAIPFPGLGIGTGGLCFCVPPIALCPLEVDALSYGMDFNPAGAPALAGRWVFSVDEFAFALPGPLAPNVASEGGVGAVEAAA